jgi:hypothetical protein
VVATAFAGSPDRRGSNACSTEIAGNKIVHHFGWWELWLVGRAFIEGNPLTQSASMSKPPRFAHGPSYP